MLVSSAVDAARRPGFGKRTLPTVLDIVSFVPFINIDPDETSASNATALFVGCMWAILHLCRHDATNMLSSSVDCKSVS